MIGLSVYLVSVGLVVMGVMGISRAFAIPGRFRVFFSALTSAIPILMGIWIFRTAGLQPGDFRRLVPAAVEEVRQALAAIQGTQKMRAEENARMDLEVRKEIQQMSGK